MGQNVGQVVVKEFLWKLLGSGMSNATKGLGSLFKKSTN